MFEIEEINSSLLSISETKPNRTTLSLAENIDVVNYFVNRNWSEEVYGLSKLIKENPQLGYLEVSPPGLILAKVDNSEISLYIAVIDNNCCEVIYSTLDTEEAADQVSKGNTLKIIELFCKEEWSLLLRTLNYLQNNEKVYSENWKILKEREEKFDKEYKHGQIFRIGFIIILFVALLLLNFLFDKEYKNTQFLLIYSVCALIISLFLLRYNRLI